MKAIEHGGLPGAALRVIPFRSTKRDYGNEAETAFVAEAKRHGWAVTKRGWPDFLCFKDGELIAVEVKPKNERALRVEQAVVLQWLADHGAKAFLWNPEEGFRRIKPRGSPP